MKKKSSISLGPGAASLLLIFVVLAMSVLGMLSLMNSRNDVRLSERSVQVMEAVYALNARAEESRAKVDGVLAELSASAQNNEDYLAAAQEALKDQVTVDGNRLSWDETDGIRTIHCVLEMLPVGSGQRTRWIRHALIVRTAEEGFAFADDDFDGFDYELDGFDEGPAETEEEWVFDD